jgi:hypothetical protein
VDLAGKLDLIAHLFEHVLSLDGSILIGDISFPNSDICNAARSRWAEVWDEDEFYWIADQAIAEFQENRWEALYEQISVCAGVFLLKR